MTISIILEDGHSIPISDEKATKTRYLGDTGFIKSIVISAHPRCIFKNQIGARVVAFKKEFSLNSSFKQRVRKWHLSIYFLV
jgi:hypothetical protein